MKSVVFLLTILLGVANSQAQTMQDFIKTDEGEKYLQTSIVSYSKGDVTIDLISVVHIGEKNYYSQLNEEFKQYDALLYELVAPKGTRPQKGQKSNNPIGSIQDIMKSVLGLESQLANVDYNPKNFVHADLTPKEMSEIMAQKGMSTTTMILDTISHAIKKQNRAAYESSKKQQVKSAESITLEDMMNPQKLRRLMAKQFAEVKSGDMLSGSVESLIVDARNKRVMEVLSEQIIAGKKKIGIFYGGAHMVDFAERLQKMGFEKGNVKWLNAWSLDQETKPNEFEDLIKRFTENSIKSLQDK